MKLNSRTISKLEIPDYTESEFKPKETRYCFVVITWNEGDRIKNQLKEMKINAHLADIIIADGNSTDGSTEISFLKEQGVRALLVTEETGLATAIRMAFDYALSQGYEGIVTVDGNGKDGVEALPEFLAELDNGNHLVQGSRFMLGGRHKNTPLIRLLGIRCIISPVMYIFTGHWFTDVTNGFRAVSREFLLDNQVQPLRKVFVRFNLQFYLNFRAVTLCYAVKEIPVKRSYPNDGSIPTKIDKFSNLIVAWEMLKVVLGKYNPPS